MYELVHMKGDEANERETPTARRENLLDAQLLQQQHLRSISEGIVEVRSVKAAGKKKK